MTPKRGCLSDSRLPQAHLSSSLAAPAAAQAVAAMSSAMANLSRAVEAGLLDTSGISDEEKVKWFAHASGRLRSRNDNLRLHRDGLHRAMEEEMGRRLEAGWEAQSLQVKFMGVDGPITKKMVLCASLKAFRKQIGEKFSLAASALRTLQLLNWDGKDDILIEDDEDFKALKAEGGEVVLRLPPPRKSASDTDTGSDGDTDIDGAVAAGMGAVVARGRRQEKASRSERSDSRLTALLASKASQKEARKTAAAKASKELGRNVAEEVRQRRGRSSPEVARRNKKDPKEPKDETVREGTSRRRYREKTTGEEKAAAAKEKKSRKSPKTDAPAAPATSSHPAKEEDSSDDAAENGAATPKAPPAEPAGDEGAAGAAWHVAVASKERGGRVDQLVGCGQCIV